MLYKYLPFDRVDVIEHLGIRFSPPQSLNDPFEELCLIDMQTEKNKLEAIMLSELEDEWEKDGTEQTEENRGQLEACKHGMLDELNTKFDPSNFGRELFSHVSKNLGILSLSRTEKSLLMWSHYASEGRGFVIALDEEHSFFNEPDQVGNITKPQAVKYSSNRLKIKLNDPKMYQKLFLEKPLEWSYEEEERIFRHFLCKQGSVGKDQYGQEIVLSCLPPETIKGVYLGYRVAEETEQDIFSALHKNGIKCSVFRSRICDNSYNIIFDKINT